MIWVVNIKRYLICRLFSVLQDTKLKSNALHSTYKSVLISRNSSSIKSGNGVRAELISSFIVVLTAEISKLTSLVVQELELKTFSKYSPPTPTETIK